MPEDLPNGDSVTISAVSPSWFRGQVQEALEHLYDYVFLQGYPLADVIGTTSESWNRGAALHRLLVEVLDRLKPPAGTPPHSALWRRYRYAFMRYIESTTVAQVAEELGVSERQARRDNHDAVEAISELLWQRYGTAMRNQSVPAPASPLPAKTSGSSVVRLDREVARIDVPAPPGPTKLAEIVESVLETIQNLAGTKGVGFNVRASEVPPLVAIERTLIRQIILNVIVGALEIARAGDEISVASEAEATSSVVTVVIPLAAVEGGEVSEGLVSRIKMARQLVTPKGGTLTEERGQNSLQVTLRLPPVFLTTVLLVDDNPGMLRLLRRYLGGSDYAVIEATSPTEALKLAQEYQPDIITLDVMMPAKDGWEVLQTLRTQPRTRDIPVLVCSVLKEQDLARSLGAAAFLPKPVVRDALLQALASLRQRPGR